MAKSHLPANIEAACRQEIRECKFEEFVEPFLNAIKVTISCDIKEDAEGNREVVQPRLGGTKIGGYPHLPLDVPWPSFQGKLLPFIAQVNLSELPRFDDSPLASEGILYYFYWATNDVKESPTAVLYAKNDAAVRYPEPIAVDQIHVDWQGEALYEEQFATQFSLGVTFSASVAETCAQEQGLLDANSGIDEIWGNFPNDFSQGVGILLEHGLDAWETEEAAEEGIAVDHTSVVRLLGYPDPCDYFLYPLRTVQGGHTDGEDRWQNILAIGSWNNMLWSDCGSLGFFIRDDDLARGDLSRVDASVMSS